MSPPYPFGLFEVFGIELEHMIVDRAARDVRPIADQLLRGVAGETTMEVQRGPLCWSNELVLHVIEMKTNGPARALAGLARRFAQGAREINARLEPMGAMLMPTAMHPWMEPARETKLWPHGDQEIYRAFDRIFDCRGHGWSNLQSMHINLPFRDDAEFGRLHAAIRLLLPILPALAASSPVMERRRTAWMDSRLEVYRGNARRVPSVSGAVIPEPVFTEATYARDLLEPIYADLRPLDAEGILLHEWVNARGAIARFERGSIEIRVLDVQECPKADLAIAAAIVAVLRALTEDTWAGQDMQRAWAVPPLAAILAATIRDAERAEIADADYLRALGWPGPAPARADALWRHLIEATLARQPGSAEFAEPLETILAEGCLARRIAAALGDPPPESEIDRARLDTVYTRLCTCLAEGRLFHAGDASR